MRNEPSRARRVVRVVHHAIFHASREGRAAEIAGWSNAAASLAIGAGVYLSARSWPISLGAVVLVFVLLRLALVHRTTVWIAGALGTASIAGLGGGLAWLFAHVVDAPAVPVIAAVFGGIVAAVLPAWSYVRLARRRARDVRDSLIDPVSVPSSR